MVWAHRPGWYGHIGQDGMGTSRYGTRPQLLELLALREVLQVPGWLERMPVLPAAAQRGGGGTGSENLLAGAVTHRFQHK